MKNEDRLDGNEYRPVLLSRRGELILWICAVMSTVAWLVLHFANAPVFFGLKILTTLLILMAIASSLGNWMDRRTVLRTSTPGLYFVNGLRRVELHWQDIQRVEVIPSSWGDKVRVLGDKAHFDFRTLAEVRMDGEVKGQMGFRDGEKILREIVQQAGLKAASGPEEVCVYYVRQ